MKTTACRTLVCLVSHILALLALVPIGAGWVEAAAAQQQARDGIGQRVRVSYYREMNPPASAIVVTGTLAALDTDTLVVEGVVGSPPMRVPVGSIWQLEVHRGARKQVVRPTLIGAGTGAVTLGGLYLALWLAPAPCYGSCSNELSGTELFEFTASGAVLGTAVGAVYGTVAGNPWQRVRLPMTTTVSLSASRYALAIAVPL